jgi:imidazolonepropionase-like amidohydrolase
MVARSFFSFALLLACGACGADSGAGQRLLLHGFRLVDPSDRSVRDAEVCIEQGVVRECTPALRAQSQRVEGNGRFLLPALWDLSVSLWGNCSARKYDDIYQEMSISGSLRVQLYYGVAHVSTFAMDNQWVSREVKRARALEYPAAELLFPDKALANKESFSSVRLQRASELPALLSERQSHDAPFVLLYYGDPRSEDFPGLSRALLAEALAQAAERGLKGYVFVDTWQRAREAAELGAALVAGAPEGELSSDLIRLLHDKGVAFAPDVRGLELDRILGSEAARTDPFLAASVPELILGTFRDSNAFWSGWRPDLERARNLRAATLDSLRRLSEAGVHIIQSSGAGWTSGTFQGYSAHSVQTWLEQAGLEPWARLAAVTAWPAELVGRKVSFAPGAPADFIGLDADPLLHAANLRRLSLLIRDGQLVDRAALKPDLTRDKFRP